MLTLSSLFLQVLANLWDDDVDVETMRLKTLYCRRHLKRVLVMWASQYVYSSLAFVSFVRN